MKKPKTVGELKRSGYVSLSVREEMRKNLKKMIRDGQNPFPGIIGYNDTVIPQIQNAILSGQDMILLGERGQAKTKIIRSLINLLDEEIPKIAGCEINDDPLKPICKSCKKKLSEYKDKTPIEWIPREKRYGEKLATPDVTIADLIGEIDPIKVAEGKYLSDELVIHFGLIPRTNRGIFSINELPDLPERIQVGLFNLMEERDIQIRGFKIRLPLDIYIVASANPEDYTNRGRIITPLRDRYGSEVRTHYPRLLEEEIAIMEQERKVFKDEDVKVKVPGFMKEIVAEITREARNHPDVNQRSGVSVRMSISNYENLISNAIRRALMLREKEAVPRIVDLDYLYPSTMGKIELESLDETPKKVVKEIMRKAVRKVFDRSIDIPQVEFLAKEIDSGVSFEISELTPLSYYKSIWEKYPNLKAVFKPLVDRGSKAEFASCIEFVLEGLYLHNRITKEEVKNKKIFRKRR